MRPLTVAIVAAALFVVVIAADASMNRTFIVEAETAEGWKEAGRGENALRPRYLHPSAPEISANRSDMIPFRLVADNGFPWPLDETFRAYVNGQEVASGEITAAARATGQAEFTIPASRLLSAYGPAPPSGEETVFVNFEVRVGEDEFVYVNVGIREVSA